MDEFITEIVDYVLLVTKFWTPYWKKKLLIKLTDALKGAE